MLADLSAAAPEFSTSIAGTLLLLIGLELVLGVDNLLMISILTDRVPEAQRQRARIMGLLFALFARIGLLFIASWLMTLNTPLGVTYPFLASVPILSTLSTKGLVLVLGGSFLIYKAVKEIHHLVEYREGSHLQQANRSKFSSIIMQIVLLDVVFSIDSVITAVGMLPNREHLWPIIMAVVLSFVVVMIFAKTIGDFILAHPALKILALAFLVTIGITITMEGFGKHVEKAFIYLPMGFALAVELLQMRFSKNRKARENIDTKIG